MAESTVLNGSWSDIVACPANAVINAACGSGGGPNCYKDNNYYTSAIRCDTLDPSYFSGQPTSTVINDNLNGVLCKDNEVAVGTCLSGADNNCPVNNSGNARNTVECHSLVSNAWQTGETPVWDNEFMGKWWGSSDPPGGF